MNFAKKEMTQTLAVKATVTSQVLVLPEVMSSPVSLVTTRLGRTIGVATEWLVSKNNPAVDVSRSTCTEFCGYPSRWSYSFILLVRIHHSR